MAQSASESPEALLAAIRRFTRASYSSNNALSRGPLSQAEWYLLWLIKHWSEPKGAQPSRLAERLHVTAGNVAQQLRHLEKLGLIVRARDAADRRIVLVQLTSKGQKRMDLVRGESVEHFKQLIAHLGPKNSATFATLLLASAEFLEHRETR